MSFDFPSSELLQLQAVVKSRIRLCIFCRILCNTKCSSIAETASQGALVLAKLQDGLLMAKSGKLELGDNILRTL